MMTTTTTAASGSPIAYVTSLGQTAISEAIAGSKLTISYAAFGSDLINSYTENSLLALTNVVSNGTETAVYKSDSTIISYSFPEANEVQFKVNLGTSIGDFSIGNWGLFDSNGNLLFIVALAALDTKLQTTAYQAGDNRVYTLNIPVTSAVTDAIDFSIISLDAASLPEVTTEGNLPEADKASYPVFHIQNYESTNTPCLASRVSDAWYYYLPYSSLLAMNNVWTGTNTYNNTVYSKSYMVLSAAAAGGTCLFVPGNYIVNLGEATVWVPTMASGDSSTNAASTAFVKNNLAGYIGSFSDSQTDFVSQIAYQKNSDYLSIYDKTAGKWVYGATQSWVKNNYLPLTGGTLTGDLTINSNNLWNGPTIQMNWNRSAVTNSIYFHSAGGGTASAQITATGGTLNGFLSGAINLQASLTFISDELYVVGYSEFRGGITLSNVNNTGVSALFLEAGMNANFGAGSIWVPTMASGDSSANAASTAFVKNQNYIYSFTDAQTDMINQIAYDWKNDYLSIYDKTASKWIYGATQSWVNSRLDDYVPTRPSDDGTNSPITYFAWYDAMQVPWISINSGTNAIHLVKSSPGNGYNTATNISTDSVGNLVVQDSTTNNYAYAPTYMGFISGTYSGWWEKTRLPDGTYLLKQWFTLYNDGAAEVVFPIAYNSIPKVAFGISNDTGSSNQRKSVFANYESGTLTNTGMTVAIWYYDDTNGGNQRSGDFTLDIYLTGIVSS